MTEKEAINYYKKAMQIHKDEFGDDQKVVDFYNTTINALQELQQYRAIGTIEECQEAMERRSAKPLHKTEAPLIGESIRQIQYRCPQCDTILIAGVLDKPMIPKEIRNCPICGQKLLWY